MTDLEKELKNALILLEAQIQSFHTVPELRSQSTRENQATKRLALETIRDALKKAKS